MPTTTSVRLTRPALAGPPARGPGAPVRLDAAQSDAVAAGAGPGPGGHLLVLGAPGTGKSTVAVQTVLTALGRGLAAADVLLLAASRRSAADLRDRVAARLPDGDRPAVRTSAALAFALLRTRAGALGEPPPRLISGPEQDLALAELLAGHALGEGRDPLWPPALPAGTTGLRAFRAELRDLLMRAAERGLTPPELAQVGRRVDRPEWVAAARVYREYLQTWALRAGTPDVGARLDPAVVVDEAVDALTGWEQQVPGVPAPAWRLVVVDDHQESTAATARLLSALAERGARVVAIGDPDVAVLGFRGAQPALVARAAVAGPDPGELGAAVVVLGTDWRSCAAVHQVTARLTARVGTVGTVAQRAAVVPATTAPVSAAEPTADVGVALLPTAAAELAFVAHRLRRAHLDRGVPWHELAVVARSGAGVAAARRALVAAGVPARVVGSDVALRDEPACRPLLDALDAVTSVAPPDLSAACALLTGPLGGLDSLGLRAVRRRLRAAELAAGGARTSAQLLVELVASPAQAPDLPGVLARPVERLGRVLTAGRQAAAVPGADAAGVLWALWHAARLAEPWRRTALAGGPAGERADRDLDAVVTLFAAAQGFVERMPQAGAAAFVEWVRAQDLPADSLAPRGESEGVAVLTPAGAAGREWDEVVVVGVQDGVWPDLRLRDGLLGAQALADLVDGRASVEPGAARAAVLADELRSFAVACSRARRSLLVTAVSSTDEQPSPFVDLVRPPTGDDEDDDDRVVAAPVSHDLRGLVARLRARLVEAGGDDPAAARLLARLAAAGVAGAHPSLWQGLREPSGDAPLFGPGELVRLSPSRVEQAHRCALRWALESAGGRGPDTTVAALGTLLHAIAAEHPTGTVEQLRAALDERWAQLGLGRGWPALALRRRADAMVDRLAGYLARAGAPVAVEEQFEARTDRAVLVGRVDRLEAGERPGEVLVVDLKTGSTVPSVADAREHPQLGAYQLAVDVGALGDGVRTAGARLVYLSQGKAAAVRAQPPLPSEDEGPSWARALVDEVAATMAAASFTATVDERCTVCPVRRSCPARPEGRQVVSG